MSAARRVRPLRCACGIRECEPRVSFLAHGLGPVSVWRHFGCAHGECVYVRECGRIPISLVRPRDEHVYAVM